jgi:sensor domain CHASE-containing protein
MDTIQLKNKIIQRIIEIDNKQLLVSIENLLNTSDENIAKLMQLLVDKMNADRLNETEDFTDYIKEWVKSM